MSRFLTAMGIVAAALVVISCGGDEDGSRTDPTVGVPVADGGCEPEPEAATEREQQVDAGELSEKQASIDEITEVRSCEIERNVLEFKEEICAAEVGKEILEGKISRQRAKQIADLKEKAGC